MMAFSAKNQPAELERKAQVELPCSSFCWNMRRALPSAA